MWILLGILAFLIIVITVIVLLPVKVIIKQDENKELMLRYRLLFKTFGENPDPNDPIVRTLKRVGGVDRLEKKVLKRNIEAEGLQKTVSDSYDVLIDLLKELVAILKYCTLTRLHITIRCGGDDAAETAISYGKYCIATDALLGALRSIMKVRRRGCRIDIGCDFFGKDRFDYDVVISVGFFRVLAAFWRIALEEAKRMAQDQAEK